MAKIDYAALKKGGFMRQKQKGYFSLRIQVVGGNLTSENIRAVADVADKYGKGYVHMTSRQGVEIPFINFENIEEVRAALADGGVKPVDQEFVQLLLVRVMKSVQAAVLIHMNLLRSLMNITSEENFHISSSLA